MNFIKSILIVAALAILAIPSLAQKNIFTNDQNIAAQGYDVVAYFNQHEAVRGSTANSIKKDGSIYYFSSAENAAAFKVNPRAYQPAYGGFCAVAMAMKGETVPSDPKTFKIRDGKLYLFYNDFYEGTPFNTIVLWNGQEQEMLSKANTNWNKLK